MESTRLIVAGVDGSDGAFRTPTVPGRVARRGLARIGGPLSGRIDGDRIHHPPK